MTTNNLRDIAINHILKMEGGYVHNPADPGGETNFGISKRSYPDLDIKELTKDEARDIYSRDYWHACACHNLPPPIALAVVDYAVNSGTTRAIIELQRLTNSVSDGQIGPNTLRAVQHIYDQQGMVLVRHYMRRRLEFIERLPTYKLFKRSWRNRILSVTARAAVWHAMGGLADVDT